MPPPRVLPRNEKRSPKDLEGAASAREARSAPPARTARWIAEGLTLRPSLSRAARFASAPRDPRRTQARDSSPTPPPVTRVVPRAPEPRVATRRASERPPQRPKVPVAAVLRLVVLSLAGLLVVAIVTRSLAGEPPVLVEALGHAAQHGLDRLGPIGRPASAMFADPGRVLPPAGPLLDRIDGRAADRGIRRRGHASIKGGVLFVPDTFTSKDGAYDLLLHFHGNTAVVRESAEAAKLNAIVAVVNLGVGSAPYQDAYAAPGTYEGLLDDIQRAVADRGLLHPRLRRVALSSWSAGYGAISTILETRRGKDPLDAILVLDGIHCGWEDEQRTTLNPRQLAPFLTAARWAAEGKILLSITHSQIEPPDYASASATAGWLLDAVGAKRRPVDASAAPPHVNLRAAEGAVAKKLEKRMEPVSDATLGTLHVREYKGNTPEHHMAHLLQMAATVLPELAARWRR